MRKFLITSEKFRGTAELVYNKRDCLQVIDVTNTDLSGDLLKHFKASVPVHITGLESAFSAGTSIVETSFEISFDMFWNAYDQKINRKRCEQLWTRLSMMERIEAWQGIDKYNLFLKRKEWRNRADPEKYLKEQYWNNDWK